MLKKTALFVALMLIHSIAFNQSVSSPDYLSILRRAGKYENSVSQNIPAFRYQNSNAPELVFLRKKFNLDSVAGFGNEASRLLNLLH